MSACGMCKGTGRTYGATDLLARSPRDQREYEQSVRDAGKVTCPLCDGTGVSKFTPAQQLENLSNAMADDILAMSDAEILAEARELGIDVHALAEKMRADIRRLIEQARSAARNP